MSHSHLQKDDKKKDDNIKVTHDTDEKYMLYYDDI